MSLPTPKVFISYNRADREWAEWIAGVLERAGYQPIIQAWDFRPGENFVVRMMEAPVEADITLAVVSENYLRSETTPSEWAAAFAQDRKGSKRKLIPVRVADCKLPKLLAQTVYIDLVGLDRAQAQQTLLDGLKSSGKPGKLSPFPKKSSEAQLGDLHNLPGTYHLRSSSGMVDTDKEFTGALRGVHIPSLRDACHFAIYGPAQINPGSAFILSFWVFMELQRADMERRASKQGAKKELATAGPTGLERGAELTLMLHLPGFSMDNPDHTLVWVGEIASVNFPVYPPESLVPGNYLGCVKIMVSSVPIFTVHFELRVGAAEAPAIDLKAKVRIIRSIFASYAGEDRVEVLKWSRMGEAVGADVFVDVLKLREGQDWEKELWQQVPTRDLFCLFWSLPASKSIWVRKELDCALQKRGLDYVHPVPLADPRDVPPPPELASKHFNDLARIVVEYEKARKEHPHTTAPLTWPTE